MSKKIIFTGTTGMVGHYINQVQWHTDIITTTHHELDITSSDSVHTYFNQAGGTVETIVHLAAETDVDRCEKDHDHAFRVNVLGTQNIVYAAMRLNVPLLYISTVGGAFGGDGAMGPFNEFSPTHPANIYGWTKLYGEQIIRHHLSRYFIVRAGWMMGGVQKDKKFVMKIIQQLLQGKREIFAIDEVVGSPTYAKELVQVFARLLQTQWWGTYHCTNNGSMSRYEIAKAICSFVDPSIIVYPVKSNYFNLPAPRAYSERSENKMLTLRGINTMSSVECALQSYLEEIRQSGILQTLFAQENEWCTME